jgi:hypothetical protein
MALDRLCSRECEILKVDVKSSRNQKPWLVDHLACQHFFPGYYISSHVEAMCVHLQLRGFGTLHDNAIGSLLFREFKILKVDVRSPRDRKL